MQSNKLDRWLTLGTNISVLIGIILLIIEINQNNELVRVQIEQMRSDTYVAWQREIASGDHLAALAAKMGRLDGGFLNPDLTQLDAIELQRYYSIAVARYYDYENIHGQYLNGFVSEEYWRERIVPAIRDWAPVWARLFDADELSARHDFTDEIKRIVSEKD